MSEDLTGLEDKGLRRAQRCEAKHPFLLEGDCRRDGVSEVDERGQVTPSNAKGWERRETAGIEVADWIRGKSTGWDALASWLGRHLVSKGHPVNTVHTR